MNEKIVFTLTRNKTVYLGIQCEASHGVATPFALCLYPGMPSRTLSDYNVVAEYGRFSSDAAFQGICQATPMLPGQNFDTWVNNVVNALKTANGHNWIPLLE